MGYVREAIEQFREAINASPNTPTVPVLMLEISNAYKKLGEFDKADLELQKASHITSFQINK
jgi:tetratricopeptide (TPR) repeat protein